MTWHSGSQADCVTQVGLAAGEQEMIVILHQDEGMHLQGEAFGQFGNQPQKTPAIHIIGKDPVAPGAVHHPQERRTQCLLPPIAARSAIPSKN